MFYLYCGNMEKNYIYNSLPTIYSHCPIVLEPYIFPWIITRNIHFSYL